MYEQRWLGENVFLFFSAAVFGVRCGLPACLPACLPEERSRVAIGSTFTAKQITGDPGRGHKGLFPITPSWRIVSFCR